MGLPAEALAETAFFRVKTIFGATLETQMTGSPAFQQWSGRMSGLLSQSPKREVYLVAD